MTHHPSRASSTLHQTQNAHRRGLSAKPAFFTRRRMLAVAATVSAMLLAFGLLLPRRGGLLMLAPLTSVHAQNAAASSGPIVLHVDGAVLHEHVKRLGMNMGGQDFYDSRQMLRNLVSRNPGFEGEQWQTILQCGTVTATSCTDVAPGTAWPEGFLDGGAFEGIAGAMQGRTGTVLHSTAATATAGTTIQFPAGSKAPAVNDVLVVRKTMPGDAAAGWWTSVSGGATLATEFKDLAPNTAGRQALRVSAAAAGQSATVASFFDSTAGHTFVRMRGLYQVHLRAKAVAGNRALTVAVQRTGARPMLQRAITLTSSWHDYDLPFNAEEESGSLGTAALTFSVSGASVLLDDVSLTAAGSNGTVFRDEVVAALGRMHPGVLRDMDSGQNFGSSLDNMLAPPEGRMRSGYNKYTTKSEDIPIGLHDFLVLAEKVGGEPWYTMPLGMTEAEARNLFEYLGGPIDTRYGARRAALGHPAPWTQSFPILHIEYGNEAWNTVQQGACIPDPAAYSVRATAIFKAMRSSPWFSATHYDLIANGQAVNTYLNQKILDAAKGFDTIDIAPYLFTTFSDDGSVEKIFGPMFAQPEMDDSRQAGVIHQQAALAAGAARPVNLAVYETGMNTSNGSASQKSIDAAIPSLGAGLTAVEHMLLMLRDLGITNQNAFHLAGFEAPFANAAVPGEHAPIWGTVIDMGGATNRVRPSFLAQQMANEAMLPTMLATTFSSDPTWNQPLSANDQVQLEGAHELQSFAFTDGHTDTLIVFNLSRTAAHTLRLAGQDAPQGVVSIATLTSPRITDSNELADTVEIARRVEPGVMHGQTAFSLAPFSMTVFSSEHHASSDGR